MPRPAQTTERRSQIVDALLRVIAERGWTAATTAEIARAAGLAPGLVHYYFGSKQEILLALVERLTSTLSARFERRASRAGNDPSARLFALLDAHVEQGDDADSAAVASWAAIGAEAGHQPEVREVYARAVASQLDALDELVTATLRAQGREVRGARRIAAGLLASIEGAYRIAASAPGVLPDRFASPTIRRIAEGLLASQPEQSPPARASRARTSTSPSKRPRGRR